MALAGVTMRAWSWLSPPSGRMPGVTIRKLSPVALRIAAASCPEAITPSKPASCASKARCSTSSEGVSSMPCSARSAGVRLVSTVTPSSLRPPRPRLAASSVLRSTRMHREELRAGARDRRGGALHRRLDIEQLRVDEHGSAARGELAREREPTGEQQLEPDLVDADAVPKLLDQRSASSTLGTSSATISRSLASFMARRTSAQRWRAPRPRPSANLAALGP